MVIELQPIDCNDVMEEVGATLRSIAEAKGLTFELALPEEAIVLPTDRRALSQILINLTNNAIKFTEQGFVRLEMKKTPDKVAFSVTDSGIGIKREDQEKLFQAFAQVHGAPRRHIEGSGLGLHLSQKLASLLGGELVVESEFGRGSRFALLL